MSGGYFDRRQYQLIMLKDDLNEIIERNDLEEKDSYGYPLGRHYPEDIIDKFRATSELLDRGERMLTRLDYLLSGDDGEDSFRKRWKDESLDE